VITQRGKVVDIKKTFSMMYYTKQSNQYSCSYMI